MLSAEDRERLAAQRRGFAEWLAGDQAAPFVIERCRSCNASVDPVFWPTARSRLTLLRRYLMVGLGNLAPSCTLKVFFYRRAGARIAADVCISPGVVMEPLFPQLVEIGEGCCLGMGARLIAHEYTADSFRVGRIRVQPGAVVGAFATVRSGVTVGERATIGFNSYVNRDVPPGDVVGGVPAKSLRRREGAG